MPYFFIPDMDGVISPQPFRTALDGRQAYDSTTVREYAERMLKASLSDGKD